MYLMLLNVSPCALGRVKKNNTKTLEFGLTQFGKWMGIW